MNIARPGRIETITSASNPRIKAIKGLLLKKNRDRENLFLAEGEKLLTDALHAKWAVRQMICSKNSFEDDDHKPRLESLAAKVRASGGDVLLVSDKLLTSITRRDNAQMVVSVIEPKLVDLDTIMPPKQGVWLGLDRVRDPGNLGTCIRTCDALGINGLILLGQTTDPFSLEAVRATMGSLFHMPIMRASEAEFLKFADLWKGTHKGQIIGTHLKGAVDHRTLNYGCASTIIVMGNEQQGLTDDLAKACNHLALIAMEGQADSLNLAVATGIVLFEARRQVLPVENSGGEE